MHSLFTRIVPPPAWRLPVILLLGIAVGLGAQLFVTANAVSYLSDRPETCINCHIMIPEYDSWRHSSHGRMTVCNDCHVPHDSPLRKYAFKAADGLRHATVFTLRREPQVIHMRAAGQAAVQANCRRCHQRLFQHQPAPVMARGMAAGRLCWECHRHVPHGRVHGLSVAPRAQVPRLESVLPSSLLRLLYPRWSQRRERRNHIDYPSSPRGDRP